MSDFAAKVDHRTTAGRLLRTFGFSVLLSISFLFMHARDAHSHAPGWLAIDSIIISGNKVTHKKIIWRELPFHAGDTVKADELDRMLVQAHDNLINTSLFNFVDLQATPVSAHSVNIYIEVTERWYVWPYPILKLGDRNFNVWWETLDFSRLSYGVKIDWRNFRGRKEELVMNIQAGYDRMFDFQYTIPYINRGKTIGLGFGGGLWQKRETAYITLYDKQQFYNDTAGFSSQVVFGFGQMIIRPDIHNSHTVTLRYDRHHFSDGLLASNPAYSVNGDNDLQYLSIGYLFKSDHRDYRHYPLKGHYADLGMVRYGLYTFAQEPDLWEFTASFRKFWELEPNVYFATGVNGKLSAGSQTPYFLLRGIGFDRDIVRGYEYYVVDARHFFILKNNMKFALVPQKPVDIRFLKSNKFRKAFYALYLNLFVDLGYGAYPRDMVAPENQLPDSWLIGYGAGLDFVTYYDVVIRLEFSVNRMNEAGLFLHFRAPI